MRKPSPQCNKQAGTGLIEVLVVIFVMAVGMLSLGKLHSVIMKDGGAANNRAIAMILAQNKIDEFRGFKCPLFVTGSACVNAGSETDFNGITSSASAESISSIDGTNLNSTYSRSWVVTSYFYCAEDTAPSTTNSCSRSYPDFKEIVATVSWTDTSGTQSVSLTSRIFANDNFSTAAFSGPGGGTTGEKPIVLYSPLGAPEVSVDVSDDNKVQSQKPLPNVEGSSSLSVTMPTAVFKAASGNTYQLVSQEEFKTVNCTCTLKAEDTTKAWTPFRTVWDGSKVVALTDKWWKPGKAVVAGDVRRYNNNLYTAAAAGTTGTTPPTHTSGSASDGSVSWTYSGAATYTGTLVQEDGEFITKPYGEPNDLNNGSTNQTAECIQCCRDHHDEDGYPTYRPYIPPTGFSDNAGGGDHKHYKADGSVAAIGEDYVESCRLKRVDGYWRVVPDWLLIDIAAFKCDYFSTTSTSACPPSGADDNTKLNTYRTRLRTILQQFVDYMDDNKTITTSTTVLPNFTHSVDPLLDISESSDDIEVENGGVRQLIARGLYADVIFKPHKNANGSLTNQDRKVDETYIAKMLPMVSADPGDAADADFDLLQFMRFYDTNLTLLAKWTPTSTDTSGSSDAGDCSKASPTYATTPTPSSAVCVTSMAVDTLDDPDTAYYDDSYSRGKIHGKLGSGETLITVSMPRGNHGLTNSPSPNGNSGTNYDASLTAQVVAKIPGSESSGISGQLVTNTSLANLSQVVISPSSASCTLLNIGSDWSFTCPEPDAWPITLSFSGPSGYVFSPSTVTASSGGSVGTILVTGPTVLISGVISTNVNNPAVTFTTSTAGHNCTGAPGSASLKKNFYYTCQVAKGWTGNIIPVLSGKTMSPLSSSYSNIQSDAVQNYTAN